jgi:hypothetical protein
VTFRTGTPTAVIGDQAILSPRRKSSLSQAS